MHLGRNNPRHSRILGDEYPESSLSETDLLMDTKLDKSKQCSLEANKAKSILGSIKKSMAFLMVKRGDQHW